MNHYELYDLKFLLSAMRVEAHSIKQRNPEYAKNLFDKLDRVQPLVLGNYEKAVEEFKKTQVIRVVDETGG